MAGALAGTAAAPTIPIALAGFAGVGFAWSILIAAVLAILQTAEASMTGRVMATLSVVLLGGMAAGGPIASAEMALAGPRAALALGAVAALVAARLGRAVYRSKQDT